MPIQRDSTAIPPKSRLSGSCRKDFVVQARDINRTLSHSPRNALSLRRLNAIIAAWISCTHQHTQAQARTPKTHMRTSAHKHTRTSAVRQHTLVQEHTTTHQFKGTRTPCLWLHSPNNRARNRPMLLDRLCGLVATDVSNGDSYHAQQLQVCASAEGERVGRERGSYICACVCLCLCVCLHLDVFYPVFICVRLNFRLLAFDPSLNDRIFAEWGLDLGLIIESWLSDGGVLA